MLKTDHTYSNSSNTSTTYSTSHGNDTMRTCISKIPFAMAALVRANGMLEATSKLNF
jgi:hypothetical protein